MTFPLILDKSVKKLAVLPDYTIANIVNESVMTGDTIAMLVGKVTSILLTKDYIRALHDGSYNFNKVLLMRVNEVVKELDFMTMSESKIAITDDGSMVCHNVVTIIGQKEKAEKIKVWFNDPDDYQDYVILKGSGRKFNNNSRTLLGIKQSVKLKVKEINPIFIDLYKTLLYENTKAKVADPNYQTRLNEVAKETKARIGYVYINYRKLDSNSRNYPLNRNGFACEYGDAFEKWLVEPAKPWLVTEQEIELAKEYLEDEFGMEYSKSVKKATKKVLKALNAMDKYNKGDIVKFKITHKELGKLLHIVDINENIIENLGGMTTSCASFDFTNSGGINAANQFGDEKFLRAANLLGDAVKSDTHQAIASFLGIDRDTAKKVMQGPNHGGEVGTHMLQKVNALGGRQINLKELEEMVYGTFGDSYKYIHKMSQYGMELAEKGITEVVIERPDGVKAVWYPYSLGCNVPMEDGSTVPAIMPYNPMIGTSKHRGLAVTILHSADAYIEHYIYENLREMGIEIKSTLDNFYGRPSIKKLVIDLTFEALSILEGYAEEQLQAIEKKTGIYRGWNLPERELEIVKSDKIM